MDANKNSLCSFAIPSLLSLGFIICIIFSYMGKVNPDVCVLSCQIIASLFAILYGVINYKKMNKTLYMQILICGCVCYLLGQCYWVVHFITFGDVPWGSSIATISLIGFYLFICSAEYGSLDSIVDGAHDKSLRKYRTVSIIAPIVILCLLVTALSSGADKLECTARSIPIMFASYYTFKHMIIPDVKNGYTVLLRPYYKIMLLFYVLDMVSMIPYKSNGLYINYYVEALVAILLMFMMIVVTRGIKRWFI